MSPEGPKQTAASVTKLAWEEQWPSCADSLIHNFCFHSLERQQKHRLRHAFQRQTLSFQFFNCLCGLPRDTGRLLLKERGSLPSPDTDMNKAEFYLEFGYTVPV
ncbi:hypothetical protein NPIL_622291 [Nephila pilipes]|uniref:Uncharacterized protein n=1 Tax=Nephila pilipes TaxID=299642 RepID=A0A8X6UER0_NEPPI|nr:hypothetical protein NPIL_622291 [Nephila pilipes]